MASCHGGRCVENNCFSILILSAPFGHEAKEHAQAIVLCNKNPVNLVVIQ